MINKLFQSKYPILVAAMNKAANLKLALASANAGIFPSIAGYNYCHGPNNYNNKYPNLNLTHLEYDLKSFNDKTGTNNLNISIEFLDMLKPEFIKLCSLKLFSHIEIVDETKYVSKAEADKTNTHLNYLKTCFTEINNYGISTIFKCIQPNHWDTKTKRTHDLFQGVIIKSTEAAGLVAIDIDRKTLIEEFNYLKNLSPNKTFIPLGGIYSSKQIKEFLNLGAETIGVGSYFIAAEEFDIPIENKRRIIEMNTNDIRNVSGHNSVVFSEVNNYDFNLTYSLYTATNTPLKGRIPMGHGINHIKEIKPLKDLVEELISEI